MTKSITVAARQTREFAEKKYTVGLDLGDRWSWYCVLHEHGEVVFEHKLSTTPKALREVFGAMPHSRVALGDGDAFSVGKPVNERVGARSNRGAGEQGAFDRRKPEERRSAGRAYAGAAGARRSRTAGTDTTSQCPGASGSDHDPGEGGLGAVRDGTDQCSAGPDEVLWGTVAGLQSAKYGRGEEQGIECGAADGIGAAVASDRVAQPTDTGL